LVRVLVVVRRDLTGAELVSAKVTVLEIEMVAVVKTAKALEIAPFSVLIMVRAMMTALVLAGDAGRAMVTALVIVTKATTLKQELNPRMTYPTY
jgi:hypothetical protein